MEQKIVLDEKSFKALSAESRINIMKNLTDRRRTLTELSQKLSLGSSTVKEHCDILVNAQLIKQIDEGRKWKYYELTQKGKQIVHPSLMEEVKILILLCMGVFAIGGIIFTLFQSIAGTSGVGYSTQTATENGMLRTTAVPAANAVQQIPAGFTGVSLEVFAISILIALVAGIIVGWIFLRKK